MREVQFAFMFYFDRCLLILIFSTFFICGSEMMAIGFDNKRSPSPTNTLS